MSDSVSLLKCRIVRTAAMGWRGTPTAKFDREDGFFLVDCWFEDDQPRMQIRDSARSLEEAMQVQVAIGMAIDWFSGTTAPQTGETK